MNKLKPLSCLLFYEQYSAILEIDGITLVFSSPIAVLVIVVRLMVGNTVSKHVRLYSKELSETCPIVILRRKRFVSFLLRGSYKYLLPPFPKPYQF